MSDKPESSNTQQTQNPNPKSITIKSCDGVEFPLPLDLAEQSGMVKSVLSEGLFENSMPLPEVSSQVLEKLIEFWENHKAPVSAEVDQWETSFFTKMGRDMLFEFLTGANYLDSKEALDKACQFVADTIKDMSVEKCRDYFGVENDFTPEEEEKIKMESPWVYEKC